MTVVIWEKSSELLHHKSMNVNPYTWFILPHLVSWFIILQYKLTLYIMKTGKSFSQINS